MRNFLQTTAAALGLLLLAACTGPTTTDRQALARGYTAFESKQYAPAESAATAYITKFPDGPNIDEAYYLRGISLAGRNQNVAAATDLRMAIQSSTRNDLKAKSWHTLGDMAYEGQRWSEARADYSQALQYYPAQDPLTNFRIGACFQAEGRWAEARPYFAKVISTPGGDAAIIDRAKTRYACTSYCLQFGAYRDTTSALNAAATLKTAGVIAQVLMETRGGAPMYFVRAGTFKTLVDAESAKASATRSYPGAIVYP